MDEMNSTPAGKKVLFMNAGSRGDCQPYVCMALALKNSGFETMLLTNPDHEKLCTDLGLKYVSNGFPFAPAFGSEASQKAFKKKSMMAFLKTLTEEGSAKYGKDVYKAAASCIMSFKPDVIILGTMHHFDAVALMKLFRIPIIQFVLANCHTQNNVEGACVPRRFLAACLHPCTLAPLALAAS